ncbi:unnamed protein product, partial [Didymodactylos carnosus]
MQEVKRNRLSIESRLCRTLISSEHNLTIALTVEDFGEELVNVSLWSDLKSFPRLKTDYNISDLTFVFRGSSLRSACKERITFLSLRCDDQIENATRYKVQYPTDSSSSNCASSTCNGCTFHFLLRTIDACPICEESTGYETFRGECHLGKQQIRKIPKRLQDRYMQLIENINPDDYFPVDNVCSTGLDDEDDNEEIDMKNQSKAKKFMSIFKKALKK